MRDLLNPHLLTMNRALPSVLVRLESAFAIGFLAVPPAPYGPLYMYTLVSLYCTYQHIGGSLVVPEVHLHEGRETACKVVLMFMHLAVKLQA